MGSITSRRQNEKPEACSMCGNGPVESRLIGRPNVISAEHQRRTGSTMAVNFYLCWPCLKEEGEIELALRERAKGRK